MDFRSDCAFLLSDAGRQAIVNLRIDGICRYLALPLAWEKVFNPAFNPAEFDRIKSKAGLNNFRISAKEWMEKTHAIGIVSKAGCYGGTYAHKDIALEFAMSASPSASRAP